MKIKLPKKILSVLDYVMIFDPIALILVLLMTLAGYASQQMVANGTPPWWETSFNLATMLAFISVFFLAGGIFILNQINHSNNQIKTSQLSPIENKRISKNVAKKIAVIAIIVSLAILFLCQKLILAALAIVILLVRGLLHNFLKISKKNKGLFWLFSNILFGMLLYCFGWFISGSFDISMWQFLLPYWAEAISLLILIFLLNGNMLYKSYQDGDEVIHMGDSKLLIWLAALLAGLAFFLGLKNNDPLISHAMLLALVLYAILVFKVNHLWIIRTVSYTTLFLIFFASSQYPYFFIFVIIAYYLAKKYNHDRVGVQFPNFGGIEEVEVKNDKS